MSIEEVINAFSLMLKQLLCKESDEQTRIRLLRLTDRERIPSMKAQTALDELCTHFLGENWYVVDPLGTEQINTIIVYEIERKFRKFRK